MSITLELSPDLVEKKDRLLRVIQNYGKVLVAFSGGVDSTFLLAAARKALSRHDVLAVTAVSPSFAKGERERCGELVTFLDVEWKIVETEEFKNPQYLANSSNRCYFCKSNLYSKMTPLSKNGGYQRIINGLNLDDLSDIRPGQQAAIEADVESPLRDTGFGKMEIREISRAWSLPTWNRPETPFFAK
jgi:uncharacterized protein